MYVLVSISIIRAAAAIANAILSIADDFLQSMDLAVKPLCISSMLSNPLCVISGFFNCVFSGHVAPFHASRIHLGVA